MLPERPSSVPDDASWSSEDDEWIVGERDVQGRLTGPIRFFDPEGRLIAECAYRRGRPHGRNTRYHPDGAVASTTTYRDGVVHGDGESFRCEGASDEPWSAGPGVVRTAYRCEHGLYRAIHYYDGEGRETTVAGTLLPERPESVDGDAVYDKGLWVAGRWDDRGRLQGKATAWSRGGQLASMIAHRDGVWHGEMCTYREGRPWRRATYANGVLNGSVAWLRPDGTVRRCATLHGQRHDGPGVDYDEGGSVVRRSDFSGEPFALNGEAGLEGDVGHYDALVETLDGFLASPVSEEVTPSRWAQLLAFGWGGSRRRDRYRARQCRRFVMAHAPNEVQQVLAALALDIAPRVMSIHRAARWIQAIETTPTVNSEVFYAALMAQWGPAAMALYHRGGRLAVRALRRCLHEGPDTSIDEVRVEESDTERSHVEGTSVSPGGEDRLHRIRMFLNDQELQEVPAEVAAFPRVTELDLQGNRLRSVPASVAEMVFLQKLNLDGNRIEELAPELAHLTELHSLMVAHNQMERLPRGLLELHGLRHLNLSFNELRQLPDAIGDLQSLRSLWMTDNPLRELPTTITKWTELRFLHLGYALYERVPPVVFELQALEELWLASPELREVPEEIGQLRRLRSLVLWDSPIQTLPDALLSLESLEEIRLGDCPLDPEEVARLREALPRCRIY